MSHPESRHLETQLIHAGEPLPRIGRAVTLPIFQSSTFEYTGGETGYHDIAYIRLNNTPNHTALHAKLATIEGGEAALVTSSGMSAISTTLLAILGHGDHLLTQNCLYGGTHDLLAKDFPALGIAYDSIDAQNPASWKAQLRPTTKVIYVEAMTNPLLEVGDLEAVVHFAREHKLISIIDNTFASPVNFRPLDLGFDLSVHSATKYLNGHSDIVAGAVIGSTALVEKVTRKLNHLGGTLDPHACFLLHRGLKTLSLRVRQQNATTLAIAKFLAAHPAVSQVNYPGLESHPQHARARGLFAGFGGVLSFRLKNAAQAESAIRRLRYAVHAPSLGGVETLVTRPAFSTHRGMGAAEQKRIGIAPDLVRLAVGLEAPEDLIEDLRQAFASL